jgi:hypothetical protein
MDRARQEQAHGGRSIYALRQDCRLYRGKKSAFIGSGFLNEHQGCSEPSIPESLASTVHQFKGPVCHSSQFQSRRGDILAASDCSDELRNIVVIGGGKSAQEYVNLPKTLTRYLRSKSIAAQLTNHGRKVTMVYQLVDAFIAAPKPLPRAISSSRCVIDLDDLCVP